VVLHDVGDEADLDRLDVGEAAARRQPRLQARPVVGGQRDDVLLDGDVRADLLVLVVEPVLLEAERAEEADRDGRVLVGAARLGGADVVVTAAAAVVGRRAAGEPGEGDGRRHHGAGDLDTLA
jgi:hypothetical protein